MLDLGEGGQRLSGNGVAEVLLDLHGDLDGVERVEAVLGERAVLADTWVGGRVPCL